MNDGDEDYEEIPRYEVEEYFIGSLGVSMDERKEFFENLTNILQDLGVCYTRNLARKYYEIFMKSNKDYKKANKELEKEILFSK